MCWEFLRMTELFSNEFSTLYTQWKLDKCEWLQHALADMSLLAVLLLPPPLHFLLIFFKLFL